MTYTSLDTIPLKLYLEILKTGNLTLLTDDKEYLDKLSGIWAKLKEDFRTIDPDDSFEKTLKSMIKVEMYTAKYNFLEFAVHCLKFDRDEELENMIREMNYKLTEDNFKRDLNLVDSYRKGILILIEKHSAKLPSTEGRKPTNIDEVILGYCSILSFSFDTNSVTVTQFYAMKKVFDSKLKVAREEQARIKNKKK